MDKIRFPYRTDTHLQLLHVIAESGAWEKYGLEVEYDRHISSSEAHSRVMSGNIEFVGGNHVSPYGHRVRGDRWVYLAQTVNVVPGRKLVVRPDSGIESIADLREKVVGSLGSHPQLNDWLQLKQHGLDVDRDEVAIVGAGATAVHRASLDAADSEVKAGDLWRWVRDKQVDAAFLPSPASLVAAREGLKVIDVPHFPMIYFTTISTSLGFAEKHPDIVERFLKGIMEGIHFFKTQPERTAQIIKDRYHISGQLDDETARAAQRALAEVLEPKLYPTTAAIENVYAEGIRHDPDAQRINPMALWDLHFLRHIDDQGFADALYTAPQERIHSS